MSGSENSILPDLKRLPLKVTYRTGDSDILNEFYIPCLQNALVYKRAVGYFTSAGLAEAARGLVGLIGNGGRMYLIASPKLTSEDIERIQEGYDRRDIVTKRLEEALSQIPTDELDIGRIKNLSWLVSNRKLDIRIARPTSWQGEGIYHEKLGLFFDSAKEDGNIVAFLGSMNETRDGLVRNYESIDVSVSWENSDREKARVRQHMDHFKRMWEGNEEGLDVMDFPDAVRKKLLEAYPHSERLLVEPGSRRALFSFQEDAIQAWVRAGFKGVFSMATGTGKTFTAIKSLEACPRPLLSIIVVPLQDLIVQWEGEIRSEYGTTPVIRKVSSAEPGWPEQLERLVHSFNTGTFTTHDRIFVISTIQTASRENFRRLISLVSPERLAIVVDEVHHSGAPEYSDIFRVDASYRLGLSATPERDWDDEGNQRIFEYFGPEVYEYSIFDAIQADKLSRYKYFVHPTALTPFEREEFRDLSQKIQITISKARKKFRTLRGASVPDILQYLDRADPQLATELRTLYLGRVKTLKRAAGKADALRNILVHHQLKRCIIYCNDLEHLDECRRIAFEQGLDPIEYSSRIDSAQRSKLLHMFEHSTGPSQVLVAVKCLDEGVDIPACDSAILVASSKSTREFIQRRGRVLRKHEGKITSEIHDILVLPFTALEEAYGLTGSEYEAVSAEFRRVEEFARAADNRDEILKYLSNVKPMFETARIRDDLTDD
jgi:superfamily II DNA or RNA helicase